MKKYRSIRERDYVRTLEKRLYGVVAQRLPKSHESEFSSVSMRECQKGTREDKRAALINLREELEDGAGIYTAASARRCLTTCAALSRLATEYVLLTITSIMYSKRPLLCMANTGHTIANIVDAV